MEDKLGENEHDHRDQINSSGGFDWNNILRSTAVLAASAAVALLLIPAKHPSSQMSPVSAQVQNAQVEGDLPQMAEKLDSDSLPYISDLFIAFRAAKKENESRKLEYIFDQCLAIVEKKPDSVAARHALLLASDCQMELANTQESHDLYLQYIDKIELTQGGRFAAKTLLGRAKELNGRQDYLLAQRYFDDVRSRYPGTEFTDEATYYTAMYYREIGETEQSLKEFEALANSETADDEWRVDSIYQYSSALFNERRYDEAFSQLQRAIDMAKNNQARSQAMLTRGHLMMAAGGQYMPSAIKQLNALIADYPDQSAAKGAKKMLDDINKKQLDEALQDVNVSM